jgi:DNA-binding SARP family transcriptional activator
MCRHQLFGGRSVSALPEIPRGSARPRAVSLRRAAPLQKVQTHRAAWATHMVQYRVLGPFQVVKGGSEVLPQRAGKERAVLLSLLLHPNEIVPADRLIDSVWGERPPRCVASALQNCISHIRKQLEPSACATASEMLLTRPPGYLLRVDRAQLDSAQLEALLEKSRRARVRGLLEEAARLLRRADGLWRGPPLADFDFDDFARSEIIRLAELRLLTLAERVDVELSLGRHQFLVCELQRLVGDYPFHERFRAQLMLALYRCARQAEALAVYREARVTLRAELGINPSRALQLLEQAILRQESVLDDALLVVA